MKLSEKYLNKITVFTDGLSPHNFDEIKLYGKICELEGRLLGTPIYFDMTINKICDELEKIKKENNIE